MEAQNKAGASLPSISCLDFERVKKEEAEGMRKPPSISTINPSFSYSQPTPPYSQPPSMTSAFTSPRAGLASPPGSRRTSKEEIGLARQSLPSISEALGSSRYSMAPSPAIVSPASTSTNPPRLPSESTIDAPRYTGQSIAATTSRYDAEASASRSSGYVPISSSAPQPYVSAYDNKLPVLMPQATTKSPPPQYRSYTTQTSAYEPKSIPASQSSSAPYQRPTASSVASVSTYQAPTSYGSQWRNEPVTEAGVSSFAKPHRSGHEDMIKHHIHSLDLANVELDVSLKEIDDQGMQLVDFSRYFISQRKQSQHLGPLLNVVPSLLDVDTLIVRSQRLQENLYHLKGLVEAHHAAIRESAQSKNPAKRPLDPESHADSAGYQFQEDGNNGSPTNGAPRKRRGRAAPPGRCHSCNRNETPEWRRGPDGARTLCNACGLHYAKLTRKMASSGSKPSTSSSLNPNNASGQPTNGAAATAQTQRDE